MTDTAAPSLKEKNPIGGVRRDSNLELYRIVVMLAIIAHHYVMNSGLLNCIKTGNPLAANSLFLLLFGCWGKIGINCFVLITGYFMCKSNITLKKFLKLVLEWRFYRYIILLIFVVTGYQKLSLKELVLSIIPFRSLTDDFTPCYVIFFLFIPFLNILVRNMNEKQHRLLLMLTLGVFSVWALFPFVNVATNYTCWFMILYLVSSYIRLYPIALFSNTKFWGLMSLAAILCAYVSIVIMAWVKQKIDYTGYYYFVADSHKFTALAASVCFFMFFKNLKIKYNPWINRIAASTFGVLCIHTAGSEMRKWLWQDTCNNVGFFNSPYLVIHAVCVVLAVFLICTGIDQLRIKFIEKPFFKLYDEHIASKVRAK